MHTTAMKNAGDFVKKYIKGSDLTVLDVGSFDINGSLKPLFTAHKYTGIDIAEGKNVDKVYDGKKIPFASNSFDVIVSSSCLEHDPTFWNTFGEMVRVVKKDGLIYLNAPSTHKVHRHPVDCWRFYPDAWKALADWKKITLLEQYIDQNCKWKNNVGIFRK